MSAVSVVAIPGTFVAAGIAYAAPSTYSISFVATVFVAVAAFVAGAVAVCVVASAAVVSVALFACLVGPNIADVVVITYVAVEFCVDLHR